LFSLLIGFGFGAYMNIVLKNILPRNQSQTSQPIETNPQSPIPQPTQPLQFNTDNNNANPFVFSLLLIMAFPAEYVLIKWLVQHNFNRQSVDNKTSSSQVNETTSLPVLDSELTPEMGDQNQLAKSVLKTARKNNETHTSNFITREYFPVTRRQMKQNWRYLRRPVREGIPTELDIEATVNQIGQQGVLLEPVLLPPRINQSELLLLIDQDGSMVPFHSLSRQLAETAVRGGRLGKAGIYYFHNCPGEYLYRDSYHQDAEAISTLISRIPERTVVLIFSDAGAARGGYSEERIELTRQFLTQLKQKVRYITWLNPIPQNRWYGTTADDLAGLVSMFEMTRRGLQGAINVLRGSH
jgi:uncharacterized protein with von Willebrand factor type A (vWA) domain